MVRVYFSVSLTAFQFLLLLLFLRGLHCVLTPFGPPLCTAQPLEQECFNLLSSPALLNAYY